MIRRLPVFVAPRRIEWRELPLPDRPPEASVRVELECSLISPGTELAMMRGRPLPAGMWEAFARLDSADPIAAPAAYEIGSAGGPSGPVFPAAFGYNAIGRVAAVGPGVDEARVGERVMTTARHGTVCDLPAWQAVPLPTGMETDAALPSYAATLGLNALRRGELGPGETVVVIGLGLIGLATALVARASGALVWGADVRAERRRRAAAVLGDSAVLDPDVEDDLRALEDALHPHGPDLVVEAAGSAEALRLALRLMPRLGRVAVAALHGEDVGDLLASDFYLRRAALTATGNDRYDDPRTSPARHTVAGNLRWALALAAEGRLELAPLVTRHVPSEQVAAVLAELDAAATDEVAVALDWT